MEMLLDIKARREAVDDEKMEHDAKMSDPRRIAAMEDAGAAALAVVFDPTATGADVGAQNSWSGLLASATRLSIKICGDNTKKRKPRNAKQRPRRCKKRPQPLRRKSHNLKNPSHCRQAQLNFVPANRTPSRKVCTCQNSGRAFSIHRPPLVAACPGSSRMPVVR